MGSCHINVSFEISYISRSDMSRFYGIFQTFQKLDWGQNKTRQEKSELLGIEKPPIPAVARAKDNGMPISEYTLRRAIRSGQLPCRIVGRTYLITWTNLVNWVSCADGCDNAVPDSKSKIRKICS